MPRPPKYPLKPVLEHRDRKVEDATLELGDAVRAREQASAVRERAESARDEAERTFAAERHAERERFADGGLRVEDLARAEAWEHAVRTQLDQLDRTVEHATKEVASAATAEDAAREELAKRKADRDVVAKDEARFTERTRRAAESAEEEEAAEAWRDRRRNR